MNKYIFIMFNEIGIMQTKLANTEEEALAEQDFFYSTQIRGWNHMSEADKIFERAAYQKRTSVKTTVQIAQKV